MKSLFRTLLKIMPVFLPVLFGAVMTANAQSAKLQLDQLDALANRASDVLDIKLDEHTLQITAKIFGKDADEAEIRELLKNLKGIYVKNFSFDRENAYSPAEVESVVLQLKAPGWTKIVGIISKKDHDNVDVYLMTIGDQVQGLAVLSIEPKEITVVNIVGPINLEKLSELEGSFGIPNLNLPSKPKKEKED